MLVIELVLPFFYFPVAPVALGDGVGLCAAAGLHTADWKLRLFNPLALALCIPLFDDAAFGTLGFRRRA
jgi:hypothetical protein